MLGGVQGRVPEVEAARTRLHSKSRAVVDRPLATRQTPLQPSSSLQSTQASPVTSIRARSAFPSQTWAERRTTSVRKSLTGICRINSALFVVTALSLLHGSWCLHHPSFATPELVNGKNGAKMVASGRLLSLALQRAEDQGGMGLDLCQRHRHYDMHHSLHIVPGLRGGAEEDPSTEEDTQDEQEDKEEIVETVEEEEEDEEEEEEEDQEAEGGAKQQEESLNGVAVAAKKKHTAAFGIPVSGPRMAALVDTLITAAMTLVLAVMKSWNEKTLDMMLAALGGVTTLQSLMLVYTSLGPLARTLKAVAQDVMGTSAPPKDKDEALARRQRQRVAVRGLRTVSMLSVMFVMRMRSARNEQQRAADIDADDEGRAGAGPSAGGMADLMEAGKQLWSAGLEKMFQVSGDELAMFGLRLSRGETLTDEEWARLEHLKEAELKREALEAGEYKEEDLPPELRQEGDGAAANAAAEKQADAAAEHVKSEAAPKKGPGLRETAAASTDTAQETARTEGGKEAKFGLRGAEGVTKPEASADKIQLREPEPAKVTEAQGKEYEADDMEDEEEEEEQGAAKPKSITDMIPAQFRPLAMGGVLIGTLYMLISNLLTIEAALSWTKIEDMPEEVQLKAQAPQLQEQLAAMVVTAYEDAGIRRDHWLKVLSAVLSAIGSAQGFVRVFQSEDGGKVQYASSPLVRLISQANGHMVWYALSFILGAVGHYDRAAVLTMRQPSPSSPWFESGLCSGKVCGSLTVQPRQGPMNYTVTVKMDFGDGNVISDARSFNLTDYQGAVPGTLLQRRFVQAVQTSITELPKLKEMFSASDNLPALLRSEMETEPEATKAEEDADEEMD